MKIMFRGETWTATRQGARLIRLDRPGGISWITPTDLILDKAMTGLEPRIDGVWVGQQVAA